tara:strand:+ start:131 stop:439 length:309 start_codon:yes stop_codon:yes gene_type:complete
MIAQKVYDASDEEQVRQARIEEEDTEKDIDFIMSQPRGRRWVYRLLYEPTLSHIENQSFVLGSSDATAFNEGARSVGTRVLDEVKRQPKLYMQMLEENAFDE